MPATTPARSRSTSARSTGCWRSTRPRGPHGFRPAPSGPDLEDQLRPHGLTLRHFPQSFEFSTLGGWIATRAGGHFATGSPTSTTWSSRSGRSRRRGVGEPAAARLGCRPEPRPRADRLRGHPRRDHRGLGAGSRPRPVHKLSCGVRVRRLRGRRRGGARAVAVGPRPVELPPARRRPRREVTAPARPSRRCSCSGSSRRTTRSTHWMDLALEAARDHGGEPGEVRPSERAGRAGGGRRRRLLAERVPRGAVSARHVRRPRRPQRHLRDGDHLGPLRGVPRHGDGGRAARRRRGLRRGAGRAGSPRLSCRFTHVYPDGPAPYFTVLAPAKRGRRGRAVGRDQGGGLGGADRRRRHDHPPPRRRPRPPALVRPPAPGPLRRRASRREASGRPGARS